MTRTLLQFRNTPPPLQGLDLSPAQILFGGNLRSSHKIRREWQIAADERELALRKRHVQSIET